MRTRSLWVAAFALAFVLGMSASAGAAPSTVKSNFSLGNDEWGWVDNTGGTSIFDPATWTPTGGNPGGFISAADDDAGSGEKIGAFINFNGKFAGDFSAFYGGKIKLDLMDSQAASKPVRLVFGSSNGTGGKAFYAKAKPAPGPTWQAYSVPLIAEHWQFSNYNGTSQGPLKPATKKVMKSTLAQVSAVGVYADYSHADGEVVSLDNYAWVPPKK